jgi:adenine phosphoribosyltransferase
MQDIQYLKDQIRSIPDFPVENIIFRDVTTLMKDPKAFKKACDTFYEHYKDKKIDKVVGIEARGFVFGSVLAYLLNVGFIPVRKKGKLPFKNISQKFQLEYGTAEIEIHEDAIQEGDKIVIIDDLIATGGTIAAAIELVEKLKGEVVECAFLVELPDLKGRDVLKGKKVFSMIEFEGE